ncbi:helix-turn-helix domain-containing protein [Streptomyces sp. 71268]|uniref:helix-turn-helix domain-containing protein n=1 Tax=Streptomyces sp. 71268 TaxID=3002640 RepID=UPI0023F98F23|nr:helix-turn-helix domain-containing protein [Streptomyces sp. 71268]WEV27439.1 helix-turn-helix domain-containing protein [Streptomyces sp. 71268]
MGEPDGELVGEPDGEPVDGRGATGAGGAAGRRAPADRPVSRNQGPGGAPPERRGGGEAREAQRAGHMLGVNVRALRGERGLSLSEVARRSGVAKSALSQLESGLGNPTIQTVFSLANALQVPVSDLLAEPAPPDVLLVRSAGLEVLRSRAVDLRMLRRIEPRGGVLELYDQRVRPGARQHSNGHPGVEHVVVTQGVLRVGPPADPYELGPGDYVRLPGSQPHVYETAGPEPVLSVLLIEYPAGTGIDRPARPH